MKTILSLALPCLAALLLSGCGGNFLIGKWTLDEERTLQALSLEEDPIDEGKGLLEAIGKGIQKGIAQILLTQFEGTQLEFTATEFRRVRNGVGSAQTYEILERPSPGAYLVKYEDGEIATWEKVEGGLRLKLTGDKDHWVYFRRAE